MKAPSVIGRGFLLPRACRHVWTESDRLALQAGLDVLVGANGLGVGKILIDGNDVQIEISGALEPGEVAILVRWLEAEAAQIEAS